MIVELERRDAGHGGHRMAISRFPCVVGRSAADLEIEASGVWNRHFTLARGEGHAFVVQPEPEAPLTINDAPVTETAVLRNGDRIGFGIVQLQFRLAPTRPKSLGTREWGTWAFLTAWLVLQIALALGWPRL